MSVQFHIKQMKRYTLATCISKHHSVDVMGHSFDPSVRLICTQDTESSQTKRSGRVIMKSLVLDLGVQPFCLHSSRGTDNEAEEKGGWKIWGWGWSMLGSHWLLHGDGDKLTDKTTEELPVACGHGIMCLFLLEELSDGQQLFQHVLWRKQRANKQWLHYNFHLLG